MNFSISHPKVLYAIVFAIPFLLILIFRYKKMCRYFQDKKYPLASLKIHFILRTVFRALAWIFLILAFADISCGTVSIPVQKNGNAISFVFDISFSMQAKDSFEQMTRLNAASLYAKGLLQKMASQDCSVSVVLTKGEAILAIPQTEDFEAVMALTENLSPALIAKPGSSIGSGIEKAIASFPKQSAQKAHIWIFTDGEETDTSFITALQEAIKNGISVSIIGFGSEEGIEALAGDGSTTIVTALQSKKIEEAIAQASKKTLLHNTPASTGALLTRISFFKAQDAGSAHALLKTLEPQHTMISTDKNESIKNKTVVLYETVLKKQSSLFMALAILNSVLSVVCGEFHIRKKKYNKTVNTITLLFTSLILCTSCTTENLYAKQNILMGTSEYNQKNFPFAIAHFLDVQEKAHNSGNTEIEQYAFFALGSTYIMQNENESAELRFNQIQGEKSKELQYALFYNQGIIAHRNGEYQVAAEYFKKALLIDGSNINAKINLEISLKENAAHKNETEHKKENQPENTKAEIEEALFSVLRENENTIWKNQQEKSEGSALDY